MGFWGFGVLGFWGWTVVSSGQYYFEGSLALNDSNQKVLSIETDPPMKIITDPQGNVRVQYNGTATSLSATAAGQSPWISTPAS